MPDFEWDDLGPGESAIGMTYTPPAESPLLTLSSAYERATDAFATACNAEAEAENTYLRAYATAFTKWDGAATIRLKASEVAAVEERAAWNLAAAVKESARAKARELEHRMMAMMSHQKFVAFGDGGTR